ncbi:putative carbohydrate esterase At4g34215 [Carex rostrata]
MRRLIPALFLFSSLFLVFTFFLPIPFSALFPPPNAGARKHVFLLAGQSNMAGRGPLSLAGQSNDLSDQYGPHLSVLRLNRWLHWETAREPMHYDIDVNKSCGVGPGLVFAKALLQKVHSANENVVIGLVPCAVGGTKIQKWAKGLGLYDSMVQRAMAAVDGKRGGGKIEALLWYQGETDTINLDDAEIYAEKMETLIINIRADLGLPHLPVIQVALASGEGNYTGIVRAAQKGIQLQNVRTVDAYRLPLLNDNLHLNTVAQIHLGHMLAQSYLSLLAELNSTPQP